jgi:hypothetical protein
VRGSFGVPKEMGSVITPIGSIFFAAEDIEGRHRFFQLLLVIAHFLEGR